MSRNSNVDLLAIYDSRGRELLYGNFSADNGKSVAISQFSGEAPAIVSLIASVLSDDQTMSGILQTNQGLLLMVARPVYDSQAQGPSRGGLVMGRFLSQSVLLSIAGRVSVPFDLLSEQEAGLTAAERKVFTHVAGTSGDFEPEFDQGALFRILPDVTGQPILRLRIPLRGEITRLGGQTGNILSITLGLIALGLLICLNIYRHRIKTSEDRLHALNDELERRVEQRTRELQETQAQYLHAEKLSAIGKLSASIAHEFNNPLQGIMTILQSFIKWNKLEEEDKVLLDLAYSESRRMKQLILSLQDFNRPSSGKKVLMDVHASVDSLLFLCRSDFTHKRISTVLNYAESLPQIRAVPDQIKQIILNLLNNAADACLQKGGVITISTWQEGERIALAIKDTGLGMKSEEINMIFQPFYSTKPAVKGTGLGLSVCHGIVQNHRGDIRVESQPGEGSTFIVLLPINEESDLP